DRPATKVSRRRPTPGPARVPSPDAPVRERRPRGGLVHAQPAGARPRLTTSHPFAALRTPPAGCEEAKGVRSRRCGGDTPGRLTGELRPQLAQGGAVQLLLVEVARDAGFLEGDR